MIDVGRDLERISDYVAGRLSDADQRAFEDRLARDPALARELELSQRLREGLERLRDGGELSVAAPRGISRRWAWGAALAATVAGVAILLWLQPAHRAPSVLTLSMTPAGGAAATFTFMAMRGPSTAPVLDLPARGLVELRASRSSASPATRYQIELDHRLGGGTRVTVGQLRGVESGADGLVHVYADAARLVPGDYELRVRAEAEPAAATQAFAFSLRPSER